jgi:hypothetical protein
LILHDILRHAQQLAYVLAEIGELDIGIRHSGSDVAVMYNASRHTSGGYARPRVRRLGLLNSQLQVCLPSLVRSAIPKHHHPSVQELVLSAGG